MEIKNLVIIYSCGRYVSLSNFMGVGINQRKNNLELIISGKYNIFKIIIQIKLNNPINYINKNI